MPRMARQVANRKAPTEAPAATLELNFDSVSDNFEHGLSCTFNRTETPVLSAFWSMNLINVKK